MYKNLRMDALGITTVRESEKIELALTYGFKGMDIDMVDFGERVRTYGLPHSRRQIDSSKMKLSSFNFNASMTNDDLLYQKQLAELAAIARLAGEIDCRCCLLTLAPASDDRPFQQNFETHRARLKQAADILAGHNIKLGLGFNASVPARKDKQFEFVHNLDTLLVLVKAVGSANVGVVFDAWQNYVAGGTVADLRKVPAEQLLGVNLADAPASAAREELDETNRKLPSAQGPVNCLEAIKILAELGYKGPVTPMPHRKQFEGMTRDRIVRNTGELMDDLWKAAGLGSTIRVITPVPYYAGASG